jgi:hypothetical protein
LLEDEEVGVAVATAPASPPSPVKTTPAVPLAAPACKVEDAALEEVVLVVLILVGFWAPQG